MISSKVKVATGSAGLTGLVVGIIITYFQSQGVELTVEWIGIITSLVAAGLAFIGGYAKMWSQRRGR